MHSRVHDGTTISHYYVRFATDIIYQPLVMHVHIMTARLMPCSSPLGRHSKAICAQHTLQHVHMSLAKEEPSRLRGG